MARRKRVPADRSAPRPSAIRRAVIFTGRVVLLLVVLSLVLVILGMTKVHDAYRLVRDNIEQVVQSIELPDGSEATRVFARDYKHAAGGGTVLAKLYLENRRKAEYREFPPMLIACVLSTEDKSFYTHGGVDLKGMLRAGYNIILRGGEVRGGGSTITQQLSRNVFLPYIKSQKTINRKMQEIILAGALEERFTKQEILEAYLNHIYFGAGAYGVKSAAQTY
ncbi:transglycosylase domain-containing protein, partial [bacterium]|nr:transglycosylase domain-containing protein [bacterium]